MIDKNQASQMGINIIQSEQENNALFNTLKTKFPQTIKDGQVSLNAIKMLLGLNESASNANGYELTFTGKGLANALYSTPCQKLLKLQESFTPQTLPNKHPKNTIIVGDNLDALKLLKSAYSEKIKMIYIDPPYNTANEHFIYPDNFRKDYKKILEEVGLIEIDENGQEVESEDLKFFKNIQGSRTHSGWLSFMLPRLKLARDLLKEDGVIFISIDDNEQANLKLLCDEIFGEDCFVAQFVWQTKKAAQGMTTQHMIVSNHEYILIVCKSKEQFKFLGLDRDEDDFSNPDNDPRGLWKRQYLQRLDQGHPIRTIIDPKTLNTYSFETPYKQDKLERWIKEERIIFPNNKDAYPARKEFLNEYENNKQLVTSLGLFPTKSTTEQLYNLFDGVKIFTNPKPLNLIKFIMEQTTKKDDIILDFFAGSGTTAQAVMELNAEDQGNRAFILVQLDEVIDKSKSTSKAAYDFCKNELKSENPVISDITIERVKRAAQKIIQSLKNNDLNLGFNIYNLQDKAQITNAQKCQKEFPTLSNLTPFDKALNLALQSGKTFNKALEIIIKDKLYKCEDAYFCIACDKEVHEHLAQTKNEMIFLDGYEDIDLQTFFNLNASFKERLNVVY